MTEAAVFATAFAALYVGHHVGDYWIQTDHQAQAKGAPGWHGRLHCALHVLSYSITQAVCLGVTVLVTDIELPYFGTWLALIISAVTHYLADRREYGLMVKLARLIPGKADFMKLGLPYMRTVTGTDGEIIGKVEGTPSLGTGAWALDQSWHLFFGVWIPSLVIAAMTG